MTNVEPRTVVEVVAGIVIIGLLLGFVAAMFDRDEFRANELAVSQAYSKHLYVEYAKSECGLDVTPREDISLRSEDTFCIILAKQKAVWQIQAELAKK